MLNAKAPTKDVSKIKRVETIKPRKLASGTLKVSPNKLLERYPMNKPIIAAKPQEIKSGRLAYYKVSAYFNWEYNN